MDGIEFEWDERKNTTNKRKHGISFEEARTVRHGRQTGKNNGDTIAGEKTMRKSYDFSKAERNPYAKRLKKQITIRLDADTIEYFRSLSGESGIAYQTLINLYLRECATARRTLSINWKPAA